MTNEIGPQAGVPIPADAASRLEHSLLDTNHRLRSIARRVDVNRLDALLFPGSSSANIGARAGYPTIIVPYGFIPNAPNPAFPAGFNAKDQPFGVAFTSTACNEPRLIELAYAFEQATKKRVPPKLP